MPRVRFAKMQKWCYSVPDVLLIRKRAFVRFARPSMLRVPRKEVLIVLTGLD